MHLDYNVNGWRGRYSAKNIGFKQHSIASLRIVRVKLSRRSTDFNRLGKVVGAGDDAEVDLHALELQEDVTQEVKVHYETLVRLVEGPNRRVG